MSRPSPTILLEHTNKGSNKTDQILSSNGIWAVFYQNAPINIKTTSMMAFVAPKYKNVSFSNSGHAINLAKKLNKLFNTTDFTVVLLSYAETIYTK